LNCTIRRVTENGNSKVQHKKDSTRTHLTTPSPAELKAFHTLKMASSSPTVLVHFNPTKQLYIDLDASKEYAFGVTVYHSNDENDHTMSSSSAVQPILFLSKMLSTAELNYWPTELEVACLVWAVRKTRHMVEAADRPTIIYTNHVSRTTISHQTTLSTTSTVQLHLRLVRALQYLQQYSLEIRHKPG
jgi:hypothetical protein